MLKNTDMESDNEENVEQQPKKILSTKIANVLHALKWRKPNQKSSRQDYEKLLSPSDILDKPSKLKK